MLSGRCVDTPPSSMVAIYHRDSVCCHDERGIQVHVALGDAALGMSKETRNRELGKGKVAGNAREGMAEYMRGYALGFCFSATAVEDANNPMKCASPQSAGKTKGDPPRSITGNSGSALGQLSCGASTLHHRIL